MVKSSELIKTFGDPSVNTLTWERNNMIVFQIPSYILVHVDCLPTKIYCHKKFKDVLNNWFMALIKERLHDEIRTYDGCWNVRKKRGLSTLSIHAFGMAIDLNASHNPLGLTRQQCINKGLKPFTQKFIDVSSEFVDCGAKWVSRPDGMHFQIKKEQAV